MPPEAPVTTTPLPASPESIEGVGYPREGLRPPAARRLAALEAHAEEMQATSTSGTSSPPTPIAASGSRSRPPGCSSTTRRTGSPTRRCGLLVALAEEAGVAERRDAMFAGERDQRHRGPPRAARRPAHAARQLPRRRRRATSSQTSTRCSTGWRPSPTTVRSGEWTGIHGQADPQHRQHRDRRLRPRPRDGVPRAPALQPPRPRRSASSRTSTAPISSRRPATSIRRRRCSSSARRRSRRSRR